MRQREPPWSLDKRLKLMTVGEVLYGPKPSHRGPCACHRQVCIDIVYTVEEGSDRIFPNESREGEGFGCGSSVGRGHTVA